MKKNMRWFLPFLIVLGLVIGVVIRNEKQPENQQAAQSTIPTLPTQNNMAPDFTLKTFDGKEVTLSKLRGKPVFVNFWNSWCPPCKAEMPDIVQEYQKYKNQIDFVGVNLTTNNDNVANAKTFVQNFKVPYTILLDSDGVAGTKYNITGVPSSFFIDKNGKIVHVIEGEMDKATMDSLFQELAK